MEVTSVPASTPPRDTLFLAGTFNDWNPHDLRFKLNKRDDGTYYIVLPESLINFSYKVTRGSWETVEGDIGGKKIDDRRLSPPSAAHTERIEILSWEDKGFDRSWNILVKEIPENTPADAAIYVSGSFNEWRQGDERFRLTKLESGMYVVRVPKEKRDTIWYKFNRGTWASVESRSNGRTRGNRISAWQPNTRSVDVYCEIDAWDDIGSGLNVVFTLILVASALQAVMLVGAILSMKSRDSGVAIPLCLLLTTVALAVLARIASYDRLVFDWQPKLLVGADINYVLSPPLFYLLVTRLLGNSRFPRWLLITFLIGPVLLLIAYAKLILMPRESFIAGNIDGRFDERFSVVAMLGTLYATTVLIFCLKTVWAAHKKSTGAKSPSLTFATALTFQAVLILSLWIMSHFLWVLGKISSLETRLAHEYTVDATWILLSLLPWIAAFMIVRDAMLLRLPELTCEEKPRSAYPKENLPVLKETLGRLMQEQRPHLNPKLGLHDLADMMNTNVHTVSWVINEGYSRNFFDFVNEYRIEEFKKLAVSDQHKNYTFLALAMDVGFSSKTTFNRAFKKATGKTPREFFSNVQESKLADIGE